MVQATEKPPFLVAPCCLYSLFFQIVSFLKALDTPCGIDHFLGTSKEWMTSRANFNLKFLCGCLGLDHIAT